MSKGTLMYNLPIQINLHNDHNVIDLSIEINSTFKECPGVIARFKNIGDNLQSRINDVFGDIIAHKFAYTATDLSIDFPNDNGKRLNVNIKVCLYGKTERVGGYLKKISDSTNGVYIFNDPKTLEELHVN